MPARFQAPQVFDKGEEIGIKVAFTGHPRPSMKWSLNGQPVSGRSFTPVMKERHAILTISDAGFDQSGTYTVTLENDLGADSANIVINVNDRPCAPQALNLDAVSPSSVVLSWKPPPEIEGVSSYISEYHVEKRELPSGQWVRCAKSR